MSIQTFLNRQGCVLSPTLFCLFINQLAEHIQSTGKHGVQMLSDLIELFILLFADDVTLMATTPSGLQNQLNCLRDCCVKMGMEVNEGKTKVMVFRKGEHLGKHEKWYYAGKSMKVPTVIHIWVLLLQQSYVTKKELPLL